MTPSQILHDAHGHEFELITSGGSDGRLRAELIETRESAERRQKAIEESMQTTRGPKCDEEPEAWR